jgi:hypothetical protein
MKIIYVLIHFASFFYLQGFYKVPMLLTLILFGLAWGAYVLGYREGHKLGIVEGKN